MAQENDVVLIHFEDMPAGFARIESIQPDYKKDWYHVKLLLLQIPFQTVTWILRNAYINGAEFTMGGKRMRLEKVVSPPDPVTDEVKDEPKKDGKGNSQGENQSPQGNVISLKDLKKK